MGRRTLLAVFVITGAGLLLRLLAYQQSVFGDELSTLYLVDGRSLGEVFSGVASDAEISPPLYFLLAWLTTRLGESPELVRLPALLAGTGLIPLTYLLAVRAAGRQVGLLAAAVVTLAPFMVVFSATGRAYSLMLFFLLASALCLTRVGENRWWWLGWTLAAAAAMYSHYTAVLVLAAEFGWALWALPEQRRRLLAATLGAFALFLPWAAQLVADLDSPTNQVLQALQGTGLDAKREAVIQWAAGHPIIPPVDLPGTAVWLAMVAALLAAAILAFAGHRRALGYPGRWAGQHRLLVLVAAAALAAPLLAAVLALAGTDLFGARNLTASWPFAAILASTLVIASGRWPAVVTGLVILAGLAYGSFRTVTTDRLPDYEAAARQIEAEAKPGDSVADLISPALTPTPLTPLDAQLDPPKGVRVFDVNQPRGEPPFLPLTPIVDPDRVLAEALARSRDATLFVVGPRATVMAGPRAQFRDGDVELPPGWEVVSTRSYPGFADLNVFRIERTGP